MEHKDSKKEIKIDDLPKKPLTPEEEDATKGGLSTGGIRLGGFGGTGIGGPLQGTSTPRLDVTATDNDDVDNTTGG